ncbi:tyrosine-type recombinase/integrase [Caulobacter sp.]|uniref:tyrosine-type recombinase/integrase n=1 Tax=Caulobacter sp. TaxID=78 RepID=UPI003BAC2555
MTVYLRGTSRFWAYDFVYKGRRYTGSTGVETRRKAEEVERKVRGDAALGLYDDQARMTLDDAAGRWWAEVGQELGSAVDVERRLEILLRLIGKDTRLVDITTRTVAKAVERRRRETYTKAPDKPGKPAKRYALANATVNADIIMSLRRILRRAKTVWEVKPLAEIDWRALTLPEPEPEVRLYSAEQCAAWLEQCDAPARLALHMLLTYGLRLGELFFKLDAFIPEGPRLVLNKRKKGAHLLPLRVDDGSQIAARASRAATAKFDTIWFDEVRHPSRGMRPGKIELRALTYYGLQARLRGAAKRAGIKLPRLIHGARHHAGTTMLSKSGNLRLTQQLLGHADIKSTMRYAHALETDLRAALETSIPLEKFVK